MEGVFWKTSSLPTLLPRMRFSKPSSWTAIAFSRTFACTATLHGVSARSGARVFDSSTSRTSGRVRRLKKRFLGRDEGRLRRTDAQPCRKANVGSAPSRRGIACLAHRPRDLRFAPLEPRPRQGCADHEAPPPAAAPAWRERRGTMSCGEQDLGDIGAGQRWRQRQEISRSKKSAQAAPSPAPSSGADITHAVQSSWCMSTARSHHRVCTERAEQCYPGHGTR